MKIYIIGPVGSGKTSLARKLSKKYNISYYELDKFIWDDKIGKKRTKKDLQVKIDMLKKTKSWIIEDVGRSKFQELYPFCDIIYYLKIPKIILYYRIIKRWVKQCLKLEKSNYHQDLNTLKQMIIWLKKGIKEEQNKIKLIPQDKLQIINLTESKKLIK